MKKSTIQNKAVKARIKDNCGKSAHEICSMHPVAQVEAVGDLLDEINRLEKALKKAKKK